MIFPFVEGEDLLQHISRSGRLMEEIARLHFRELCEGIQYLKSKYIVHRDIKLENTERKHVRLSKFILCSLEPLS